MQVLRMINPSVTNSDRSQEFIAVVVDVECSLSQMNKRSIKRAIKDSGHGSTTDN